MKTLANSVKSSDDEPVQPRFKKETVIDHVATGAVALKYRQRAGLSQIQVGTSIGQPGPMISMLESGKRPWSQDLFQRYIKAVDELKSVPK